MKRFLEKNYLWLIFFIMLFMLVVSVINAKNDSPIYDEIAHIPAGYSYLTQHDMRLNPEHPPLLKDLAAFPLLFMHLNFDTTQPFWNDNPNDAQWNAGKYFLYQAGNNPEKIVFWSRLPIILLSLILGIFIFVWTRQLAGITAGVIALILYAFDPNILGHNHYVTTDLGIAAFFAFTLYYFIKFLKNPTWKNVFFGGIFLGLLQLAKFSSVLIFPVLGLMLLVYPLLRKNHSIDREKIKEKLKLLGEYLGKGFLAFGISLLLVWSVYQLNTFAMPTEKLPQIMQYYFHPNQSKNQALDQVLVEDLTRLNKKPAFAPLADYFFGIARVFQRVAGGNVTYFMGEVSVNGFLSYFPVVFLIKEPLPIIFLIIFALFFSGWQIGKKLKNTPESFMKKSWQILIDYIRTSPAEFSMLLFILLYSITSITGRLNIGLRHLFPIFPFIYILLAKKITEFIKKEHRKEIKIFFSIILFSFLAWLILETTMVFPNYVSYFNQLAGGPKNGYHYVTDSNADWGQDLIRLRSFLNKHPEIAKIRVDYFGMADLNYYLKDRYISWWRDKRPIEPGWYAISVELMQESIYDQSRPDNQSYRFLKEKIPDYQVGTSILIYYIDQSEANKANNL
jgi:hypothetical protein